jgi:hypothetical protein
VHRGALPVPQDQCRPPGERTDAPPRADHTPCVGRQHHPARGVDPHDPVPPTPIGRRCAPRPQRGQRLSQRDAGRTNIVLKRGPGHRLPRIRLRHPNLGLVPASGVGGGNQPRSLGFVPARQSADTAEPPALCSDRHGRRRGRRGAPPGRSPPSPLLGLTQRDRSARAGPRVRGDRAA